ncbi:MAG: SDR family NAD(P)-dependent oxidoreductase [Lachnoclostridium sp.]|nr:SDR family NAD(P)-dependent oxidoreductase [Lachnospira sp.]MCM1248676.1 SDR family NAD(P)-dependent oxidoreductase [Lachnoclostridium sp.]
MNIILITGASSGIGMEFAMQMDNYFTNIDEFWLVARSRDKLEEVAKVLQHKTRIFDMDVTEDISLEQLLGALEAHHGVVRILINAAGYGLMGEFASQDRESALGMVRLNCEALTNVTHRLLPYMRKNSRIIQLASSAAFLPQPDFAVYAATKSYVLSFSRALGAELKKRGIYVTSVCPGPVDTPFFDIAERTGTTLRVKKYTMVSADRVVELALRDSFHKKTLSVCSLPIKAFQAAGKFLPHDFLLAFVMVMKKLKL